MEKITTLKLFHRKVDELKETSMLKEETQIGINFSAKKGGNLQIRSSLPNEDKLKSFIMSVRFFLLEKEPTQIYKICSLIVKSEKDDRLKNDVKYVRERMFQILNESPMRFEHNNKVVTPNEIIKLWFNAHYFHCDVEQDKRLNELLRILGPFIKYFLIGPLFELAKLIIHLDNIIMHYGLLINERCQY